MRFVYGKQDWVTRERGQENVYLLTNGLGGFSSASMINSNTRSDQALLMACLRAPNLRYNMVNRLEELLGEIHLSSQEFAGADRNEEGYRYLNSFIFENYPEWTFQADGVEVTKRIAMAQGKNLTAVQYRIENYTDRQTTFTVIPHLQFVPKGQELKGKPEFAARKLRPLRLGEELPEKAAGKGWLREGREEPEGGAGKGWQPEGQGEPLGSMGKELHLEGQGEPEEVAGKGRQPEGREEPEGSAGKERPLEGQGDPSGSRRPEDSAGGLYEIASDGLRLYFETNGTVEFSPRKFCGGAFYASDACDGRNSVGRTCVCHRIMKTVPARGIAVLEILYSMEEEMPGSADEMFAEAVKYRRYLAETAMRLRAHCRGTGLRSAAALQLAVSAGQFISKRESTGGSTILAGYPFFEDWGRDTMIALEGCCMVTGQFGTARSILRTFARYCSRGLMPNLFPEGGQEPRYNTADAALLFINSVYAYWRRTGDDGFVREMWPVMTEIIKAYRNGTDFGIGMDGDGLIRAGQEYDQVTWMDVRIGNHLPTPRHGKPVEINAYWYNGLRIMEELGERLFGQSVFTQECGRLAGRVRASFRQKFWMEEEGRLRDVLSGTRADEQFRCNQIWAVSMPFSMLDRDQERRIVDAVYEKLYTPYGLRTLEKADAEFYSTYGGPMQERDLAYHQGTVWVFPMGAYYLAYLKTREYAPEAVRTVRRQISVLESAMREGCIGQLPEIYDGGEPTFSRGCFAQAWSVGEMLRVYEVLDRCDADGA